MKRTGALLLLLALTADPCAHADGWDFAACMDGGPSVDVFACADAAVAFDPVARKLAVVVCVADKIKEHQIKILDCLDSEIDAVHAIVMLPKEASRVITEFDKLWTQAATLKQQVESLAAAGASRRGPSCCGTSISAPSGSASSAWSSSPKRACRTPCRALTNVVLMTIYLSVPVAAWMLVNAAGRPFRGAREAGAVSGTGSNLA